MLPVMHEDFYLETYLCLKYLKKINNIFLGTYLCIKYSEDTRNSWDRKQVNCR